jgi:hypothetical protein
MPRLNALAKKFHSIPASSASSERAFSKLALTATDLRNRIDPEKVAELICYQSLLNNDFESSNTQVIGI